jgi:hypothetical protein
MIETKIPEINVDELMEKIRAEVKKRKKRGKHLIELFHMQVMVPHPTFLSKPICPRFL